MRFSQRIGKSPVTQTIQLDSMDDRLRNRLFNVVCDALSRFRDSHDGSRMVSLRPDRVGGLFYRNYCDHFGEDYDSVPLDFKKFIGYTRRKVYEKDDIYFFYDFFEFLVDQYEKFYAHDYLDLVEEVNAILKEEKSAYRFTKTGTLIPITNEVELVELDNVGEWGSKYQIVYDHLLRARSFFSDRDDPQYKQCTTESVHAMEAAARIILNDPHATLGALVKKLSVHPQLKKSIENIYGYASDVGGVRHGNKDRGSIGENEIDKVDVDDARTILVLSHTVTNYLVTKFLTL